MSSDDMASLVLALLLLLLLLLLLTFSDIEKRFEQSTSSIIGDKFELVDEVFDDTDDRGESGDIGDSDDTDDEQPSRDDDDGDIFSLQMRAVNTSSSSISESELGGLDTGRIGSLPAARKLCSNSSNWPMKFKFGDIIGRASLTNLYASISDSDL